MQADSRSLATLLLIRDIQVATIAVFCLVFMCFKFVIVLFVYSSTKTFITAIHCHCTFRFLTSDQ